jgi:uncharacterized protein
MDKWLVITRQGKVSSEFPTRDQAFLFAFPKAAYDFNPFVVNKDMEPSDWDAFRSTFNKFIDEEEQEDAHAEDADFEEGDHPRDDTGKFSLSGSAATTAGKLKMPSHARVTSGGTHGGGQASYREPHSHKDAHARMTQAGFKREDKSGATEKIKHGKSTAHSSTKTEESNYSHPEGHTAKVRTKTNKQIGTGEPGSYYDIHFRKEQAQDYWNEADHPRGQPGNAGEFGPGGGGGKKPIDLSKAKRIGSKLGSNPGGTYEHEGKKYYVKQGKSPDHVKNELLAGSLYQLAGAKTLNYHPVAGGNHIATEWQDKDKDNANDFSPEERTKAQADFAIHAWLANWDAAGLDMDNQAIIGGEPTNVDVGGALTYRAQGAPKGKAFGNEAGEWDTLRDKKLNPANARLFGDMTPDQMKASAKRVLAIPDEKIRAAVKEAGLDDALADKLVARKADIGKRAGIVDKPQAEVGGGLGQGQIGVAKRYQDKFVSRENTHEFMKAAGIKPEAYDKVSDLYSQYSQNSGGETEKKIISLWNSDTEEGRAMRAYSAWNEWQSENTKVDYSDRDEPEPEDEEDDDEVDEEDLDEQERLQEEDDDYEPRNDEEKKAIAAAKKEGQPIFYRKGPLDKRVVSFSTDPKGARSGTGEGFRPDRAYTYKQLKDLGYTMLFGARGAPTNVSGQEKEHAWIKPGGQANDCYAMDEASARTFDVDGRLHVALTNISKANVCPYYGREIPGDQELGLDPEKMYYLFRAPEELAKAAASFNNLPLLSKHQPVNAMDHKPELIIGSTGTDATFQTPYLKNSLVVWASDAIEAIERGAKKELSAAYRYQADMTPGEYLGVKYDGVMRELVGNHIALVENGRAGSDVIVGDAALPTLMELFAMKKPIPLSRTAAMVKGALLVSLRPKLAQDASIDLNPILKDLTYANFKDQKAAVLASLKGALKGKLAQDANVSDLTTLMDALENVNQADTGMDDTKAAPGPQIAPLGLPAPTGAPSIAPVQDAAKEFLQGKLSAEDMAAYDALCAGEAMDEDDDKKDDDDKKKGNPFAKDEDKDEKEKPVDKKAMDEAIKAGVKAESDRHKAIRDAERDVRPYVGELAMAFDSAEEVYRHALKAMNIEVKDVHASALPTILKMQKKPGDGRLALDSTPPASKSDFATRFPMAARISA